ncbi:MAG: rhomboid family intramembrane serine protease [Pseudomonadales bacterium]|nr:rhomboid family intramembrane serine protease [Pseudomonadales bacterium]
MNKQENPGPVHSFEIESHVDLASFCQLLWQRKLPHRVISNVQGRFLVVGSDQDMLRVKTLFHDWSMMSDADRKLASNAAEGAWVGKLLNQARKLPVTAMVSLVALLIYLQMHFFDPEVIRMLSFAPAVPSEFSGGLRFESLSETFSRLQLWRLISPVFMHFSVMHLAFDLTIVIYFMRRVETRLGSAFALLCFLLIGIFSNFAQYYFTSASLFGGLSGVAYGLVGFVIVMRRAFPEVSEWAVNPAFLVVMVVFLILYSTGVTELFNLYIANAAHWAGLVAGMLLAGVLVIRRKFKLQGDRSE